MKDYVDPVVEEVRERGRKFTLKYENNVEKIMEELRKVAEKNKHKVVSHIKIVPKE